MNIDTSDKAIKRFNCISDTMMRFISKEGPSQFPTVIFLANRMFLSDKLNIIKDKDLPFKLNSGCNFIWYSDKPNNPPEVLNPEPETNYEKIFVNTRFCIKEIIENELLCFKQYPDNPDDIVDSFTMGNNMNYFATKNDLLQYGLLKNKKVINITTLDLNVSEIKSIYRYKDNLDVFITDHKIFLVNSVSKIAKSIFTDEKRTFKDFCICSNGKIVLATDNKGLVLIPKNTSTLDYNTDYSLQKEMLEYKEWWVDEPNPEYIPPDPETGEGGSGSPTIRVHYDNGMPPDNNLTFCKSSGTTVHIGNALTGTTFDINSPKDTGIKTTGLDYHRYIYKYESIRTENGYSIGDYSYNLLYEPISFIIDNDLVYIYDSSHVDCFKYKEISSDKDDRLIFSLRRPNGIFNIKKFGCDGAKDFFYIDNNNKLYTSVRESDIDFPLLFVPIDFIYKRDQNTKNLKCQVKKCGIRRLIKVMTSDQELHKLLKVYDNIPTFLFIHHHNTFIYFGNDDRNKAAKEVKDIANAFDIG